MGQGIAGLLVVLWHSRAGKLSYWPCPLLEACLGYEVESALMSTNIGHAGKRQGFHCPVHPPAKGVLS